MQQTICVPLEQSPLCQISGITFAQVPYWYPFYNTRDLKLDILRPFGPPKDKRPLLVWICGGAWLTMERSAHLPNLQYFAQHGYIVASVEYRMTNCAQFPAQLQDIKSAIRYLRTHAEAYGIDTERIAVMGESAGGYLAAMAAATSGDTTWDSGENCNVSSAVCAAVDYYGPIDFTLQPAPQEATGRPSPGAMLLGFDATRQPQTAKKASVLSYLSPQTPPMLLLHGKADAVVPHAHSDALYQALQQNGVASAYYLIEDAPHAGPHFYQTSINEKVLAFLKDVL